MISDSTKADPNQPDPRAAQLARIANMVRLALIGLIAGLVVWLLRDVVLVVFAAALFAVLLHGLSSLLSRTTRLPYGASLAVVALGIVVLVGLLGWYAGPHLVDEATELRRSLGQQIGQWHEKMSHNSFGRYTLRQLPASFGGDKPEAGGSNGMPAGLAGSVAGFFESVFGALGTMAVIVIAGLYFAATPSLYVDGVLRLLPREGRATGRKLAEACGDALWHWTAGQAVDMLCVGVLSGIGLAVIGVPLALVLGVVAGLANFVPYIGAIVGFVPALLIAFAQGPREAAWVAALYVVVQGLEGNLLAPIIQRRAAHLAPALTILSQTAVGALFGLPGLMLATPLAAALVAVVQVIEPPDDAADDARAAKAPAT